VVLARLAGAANATTAATTVAAALHAGAIGDTHDLADVRRIAGAAEGAGPAVAAAPIGAAVLAVALGQAAAGAFPEQLLAFLIHRELETLAVGFPHAAGFPDAEVKLEGQIGRFSQQHALLEAHRLRLKTNLLHGTFEHLGAATLPRYAVALLASSAGRAEVLFVPGAVVPTEEDQVAFARALAGLALERLVDAFATRAVQRPRAFVQHIPSRTFLVAPYDSVTFTCGLPGETLEGFGYALAGLAHCAVRTLLGNLPTLPIFLAHHDHVFLAGESPGVALFALLLAFGIDADGTRRARFRFTPTQVLIQALRYATVNAFRLAGRAQALVADEILAAICFVLTLAAREVRAAAGAAFFPLTIGHALLGALAVETGGVFRACLFEQLGAGIVAHQHSGVILTRLQARFAQQIFHALAIRTQKPIATRNQVGPAGTVFRTGGGRVANAPLGPGLTLVLKAEIVRLQAPLLRQAVGVAKALDTNVGQFVAHEPIGATVPAGQHTGIVHALAAVGTVIV